MLRLCLRPKREKDNYGFRQSKVRIDILCWLIMMPTEDYRACPLSDRIVDAHLVSKDIYVQIVLKTKQRRRQNNSFGQIK